MTIPGELDMGYPRYRAVHVGLRDGSTVRIRPVSAHDLDLVVDLFARLSERSIRMRFHGVASPSRSSLQRFVEVDYRSSFSLIAESGLGESRRSIALATYLQTAAGRAEMAVVVDDSFQGLGLGSVLIEHLGETAAAAGITTFELEVLASNWDMLEVLRNLEHPLETSLSAGVVHAEYPTSPTPQAIESFEQREAVAASAGVARLVRPNSIAVIGASRRRGTIAGEVFHNLIDGGFEGPVFPINPKTDVVQSIHAYPSVLDVPGDVDLAVIVVPAPLVTEAAHQCGEKGVKALLVITAGFAEVGDEGTERQRDLLEIARAFGIRIVGPNCMGLINTDPALRLNASFAPSAPTPGNIGFSSQSGALGIAVIDRTLELGLGISTFVSVGNKADISGNDLLQFWEDDDKTQVILLTSSRSAILASSPASHAACHKRSRSSRSRAGALRRGRGQQRHIPPAWPREMWPSMLSSIRQA